MLSLDLLEARVGEIQVTTGSDGLDHTHSCNLIHKVNAIENKFETVLYKKEMLKTWKTFIQLRMYCCMY